MHVHKLRVQRGWSQEQLAELTGLSVRTIQRIERGQNASVESLKALAAVFEIDFSILREPQMAAQSNTMPGQPMLEPSPSGVSAPGPDLPARDLPADEALALARVRKIKRFYWHLIRYGAVMLGLFVINLLTRPQQLWVIWPALGWGLGVLAHGLRAFDKVPFLNGDWEKRQVEKYLGRKI